MKLKGIAIEVCGMESSNTLDAYQLYLKLQTTLSFYSSRTDSVEFCMTLTLSGVSKIKLPSEQYGYDPPFQESQ